jgi:heat shock protein HslJ
MKTITYTLFSLMLLSSCDDSINVDNIDPFLGTWELKNVLIEGDAISTPPSKITIIFSEETKNLVFSGQSTCNFYGGEVIKVTPKKDISLSAMYSTEMACSPDLLNMYENDYYKWLTQTNQYSIEDNKLVLSFEKTYLNFEKVN